MRRTVARARSAGGGSSGPAAGTTPVSWEPRLHVQSMNLHLDDKIAIVTGSSRGLGLASAAALAEEGCRVCLCALGAARHGAHAAGRLCRLHPVGPAGLLGADELDGRTAMGALSLRYDTIRSIARHSRDSALVTLLDGREMVLSDTREVGHANRGIDVDDGRYGRVLISCDAFGRVEFSSGGSGPAYGDFPPGRPLAGSVTTRDGRRFAGWLVYDFDESETTETFDAPSQGVDYTIPFGLITSIVPPGPRRARRPARGILHDGEELQLECTGDLGEGNAGMLTFVDGRERPEYVPWTDVEQVDLDRPPSGHR